VALAALTFALGAPALAADQGKSDQAPGHDPAGPGNSENVPGHETPAAQSAPDHGKSESAPHGKAKGHAKGAPHRKAKGHAKQGTHTNSGVPHQKVTLCHATGSATNPFVKITISVRAVPAHKRHQDGRDIIPAPAAGCPGPPAQTARLTRRAENRSVATRGEVAPATAAGTGGMAPTVVAQTPASIQVLGVRAGSSPRAARRVAAARARAPRRLSREATGRLPFTGWDAVFIAILGAAGLLTGLTLYRVGRSS
jgi:hypothetical protein